MSPCRTPRRRRCEGRVAARGPGRPAPHHRVVDRAQSRRGADQPRPAGPQPIAWPRCLPRPDQAGCPPPRELSAVPPSVIAYQVDKVA